MGHLLFSMQTQFRAQHLIQSHYKNEYHYSPVNNWLSRAGKMVQQVKVLATKHDKLTLDLLGRRREVTPTICPLNSTSVLTHIYTK